MNLTLLIDLDDTLLPNSTEKFLPVYLSALAQYLGLDETNKVIETLYWATQEALENPRIDTTIKETFDSHFFPALGTTVDGQAEKIKVFYRDKFPEFSPNSHPDPEAVNLIQNTLEHGYRVAIATNPIFPKAATYERMRWAGIDPENPSLEIISTYEDFHFGKPHPGYFLELIAQIGWPEGGYVMVGDSEEMDIHPAKKLGMATYLIDHQTAQFETNQKNAVGTLSGLLPWLETLNPEQLSLDESNFEITMCTLQSNPAALQTLIHKESNYLWLKPPPAENEWNATQIICHLRDVDREIHLPRLEAIRYDDTPFLPAINADAWAESRQYHLQDGNQAFEDFIKARKAVLSLASDLVEIAAKKEIRHTIFGPITLDEIMRIAARHDSLHVHQLSNLIKA
jgi:FMN phosphatase YigB (HAD superfamily)